MKYRYTFESKFGPITLGADAEGSLTRLAMREEAFGQLDKGPFRDAIDQLEAYFTGGRRQFELRLAPPGTEFQQSVWRLLVEIPYGSTRTYGELARELGDPNRARAVGAANGANPIAIIVPCHRVIGSNGALTGFAYGTSVKRALLDLECKGLGLFSE